MDDKNHKKEVTERLTEFGQRLYGKEYGWVSKFARALAMTPQGLTPYINGKLPGNKILARLNKLGCSSDWLLYGEKEEVESKSIALMNIPIYAFQEGTKESVVMENVVEYISLPKNPDDTLFGVKVKLDSMAPIIHSKDIIIVSRKEKYQSGDICLIELDDHRSFIRYVTLQDKQVLLTAKQSDKYPPQSIPKSKVAKIMRVMKIIRSL